jgi:hypothetical protein
MSIRDQKKCEARIKAMAAELQTTLCLDWLTITHQFNNGYIEGDERVCAATIADWEYRQASIIWQVQIAILLEDDALEEVIVHELVHVLNASLWESLPERVKNDMHKMNEYATENVTRAIISALHS